MSILRCPKVKRNISTSGQTHPILQCKQCTQTVTQYTDQKCYLHF